MTSLIGIFRMFNGQQVIEAGSESGLTDVAIVVQLKRRSAADQVSSVQ